MKKIILGVRYIKQGLYDRTNGNFLEGLTYKQLIAKYGDCPQGTIWEGNKNVWNETFNQK